MAEVSVDFGTSNTVVARMNETTGRPETIAIPGIAMALEYQFKPGGPKHVAHVTPSVIHYAGENKTLIGNQVIEPGLVDHPFTLRWMKRAIARDGTRGGVKKKKTGQGFKSPAEAGQDFLRLLLTYASDRISLADDSFTFTAPVEAFENFQDWLMRVAESLGIRRVRLLDEPTAAIFGYQGAVRKDDRFQVFDFGGGTLDTSVVRLDLLANHDRKAIQIGQAGDDLGGMNIDLWLAEDFAARHRLDDFARREMEAVILREAETVKMTLSAPDRLDAELSVVERSGPRPRLLQTVYWRECPACLGTAEKSGHSEGDGCLGCVLKKNCFLARVEETVDRALENAAIKAGVRKSDLTRVVVTGGTSLIPSVRRYLETKFPGRVEYDHPFDSVARGACGPPVDTILRHDYAIEGFDRTKKEYFFSPLFHLGDEYPTPREKYMRKWLKGTSNGQTRIGLVICEVSQVRRRKLETSIVDRDGVILLPQTGVRTDFEYIKLNENNPTFVRAEPAIDLERDRQRFEATFRVDGNRRLLVTVVDRLKGETLLEEYPVVRL